MNLRATRRHASAQRLEKVLEDSDRGNIYLRNYMGEVLEHCEVRGAFGEAPQTPTTGPSSRYVQQEATIRLIISGRHDCLARWMQSPGIPV